MIILTVVEINSIVYLYLKMIRNPLKICYWFGMTVFNIRNRTISNMWRLKEAFIFETRLNKSKISIFSSIEKQNFCSDNEKIFITMVTTWIFNTLFIFFDVPHNNLSIYATTSDYMWIGGTKLKTLNIFRCFQIQLKTTNMISK